MTEYIREQGSSIPDPPAPTRETGVAADEAPTVDVGEPAVDEELAEQDPSFEVRKDGSIARFGSAEPDEGQEREQASQSYSSRERGTSTGRE